MYINVYACHVISTEKKVHNNELMYRSPELGASAACAFLALSLLEPSS